MIYDKASSSLVNINARLEQSSNLIALRIAALPVTISALDGSVLATADMIASSALTLEHMILIMPMESEIFP